MGAVDIDASGRGGRGGGGGETVGTFPACGQASASKRDKTAENTCKSDVGQGPRACPCIRREQVCTLACCRVNGWSYSMHVPESLRGAAACIRTHADAGFTTVHAGMQAAAALTSTLNP